MATQLKEIYCLLTIIILVSLSSGAQNWQQLNGPFGGDMDHIEATDSVIVASVVGKGFYYSRNQGASWTGVRHSGQIRNILKDGNMLMVVSVDSIYYSTDHFRTFKTRNYPGYDAGSAYTKSGKIFLSGYWTGNEFSQDTANTWSSLPYSFNQMAIEDSVWYVGSNGLKVSRDNGQTFQNDTTIKGYTNFITTDSNEVWVGSNNKVFYSTNYGLNWTVIHTVPYQLKSLKKYGNDLFVLHAGSLDVSNDHGLSWTQLPLKMPGYYEEFCVSQGMIFIASYLGVYKSSDGITWEKCSKGIQHGNIQQLGIKDGLIIYNNDEREMGFSADMGHTWNSCKLVDSTYNGFKSFEYADGILFGVDWHQGVYTSTDTGKTWSRIPINNSYETDNILYSAPFLIVPQILNYESIFQTTDMGSSWNQFPIAYFSGTGYVRTNLAKSPHALIYSRMYVYRSLDNGISWTNTGTQYAQYNQLAFSGNYFYAVCSGAIYRGDSYAANWVNVYPSFDMDNQNVSAKNSEVFVSSGKKILYSPNDGVNWNTIDSLPYPITELVYEPPYIYAGTDDQGIWRKLVSNSVTGMVKPEKSGVEIFPNPSSGIVHIMFSGSVDNGIVRIYDVLGNCLQTKGIKNRMYLQEDVSNYRPGIYFIEVDTGRELIMRKMIRE